MVKLVSYENRLKVAEEEREGCRRCKKRRPDIIRLTMIKKVEIK